MDTGLTTGIAAIIGTVVGAAIGIVGSEIHDRHEAKERRRRERMDLYDQLLNLSEIPESEMLGLAMGEKPGLERVKTRFDNLGRAQHLAVVHGAPSTIVECIDKLPMMLAAAELHSEPSKIANDLREGRAKLSRLCAEDIARYS